MIRLFIYDRSTLKLIREDFGPAKFVMQDLHPNEDFTLVAPPTFSKDWLWQGTAWVKEDSEESLLGAQSRVWEAIKQSRYKAVVSGVYVPSVDKVFHTDEASVIQYNNIGNMIALDNFEPIEWKVMDNTWVTMTVEVFKDLQKAMAQNTNRIYRIAEEHKAKMMELDNPEEYDYSSGWDI